MRFTKTIATASVAAVLGLGGVSVAGATSNSTTPQSTTSAATAPAATTPSAKADAKKPGKVATELRRRIRREAGKLAAKTIGITTADLRQELVGGKTIAAIATEHSVQPQKVIDTLVVGANAKINAAVTANKITAARAAKLKVRIDKAIPRIVNDWHPKAKS